MSDNVTNKQEYHLYTRQERQGVLRDVTHVKVHPFVRAIKKNGAFYDCLGLMTAVLHDGLEEIGAYAFA